MKGDARRRFLERRYRRHAEIVAAPETGEGRRHRSARIASCAAERLGLLVRPTACQWCRSRRHRLQRHHWDYAAPLLITFLCPECHRLADAMAGRTESEP